ncbi:MAG: hypothetical protein K6G03_02590, partial [Lachnospiraceae bacterium]|nr:hypothetical protein [Lachnospiraceae bacterium]
TLSVNDGRITVSNEKREEVILNELVDLNVPAKEVLLEVKRLFCDFYYLPEFFTVNGFYVRWGSDFDEALMIGDDEPRGICFYDCGNISIGKFADLSKEELQHFDFLEIKSNEKYIVHKKGESKQLNIEVNYALSKKLRNFPNVCICGENIYMDKETYEIIAVQVVKRQFLNQTAVLMNILEGKWIIDGFTNSQI